MPNIKLENLESLKTPDGINFKFAFIGTQGHYIYKDTADLHTYAFTNDAMLWREIYEGKIESICVKDRAQLDLMDIQGFSIRDVVFELDHFGRKYTHFKTNIIGIPEYLALTDKDWKTSTEYTFEDIKLKDDRNFSTAMLKLDQLRSIELFKPEELSNFMHRLIIMYRNNKI